MTTTIGETNALYHRFRCIIDSILKFIFTGNFRKDFPHKALSHKEITKILNITPQTTMNSKSKTL